MAGEFLPPVVTRLEANIDDFVAKVEEAKGLLKSMGKVTIPVNLDLSNASVAAVKAQAQSLASSIGRINLPVGLDLSAASGAKLAAIAALQREARLAAAAGGGGGGGGRGGGFFGWLQKEVPTFNGPGATDPISVFMNKLPLFTGSVQAWHLALDGAGEALAVVLPAVIGLGIYGAIAAPVISDMTTHLKDMNTVTTATGQSIKPLTGAFGVLQDAVKPSVYQLYGDAVSVLNGKLGTLKTVSTGVGSALDMLGARAALALKSAGMSQFMANAATDVRGLGTVIGNVFGIVGNLLKTLPGYAQGLLNVLSGVTHGIEVITGNSVVQGITHVGLAFHGAWIWGGVFANLLGKGITSGLTGISGMAFKAGLSLTNFGRGGAAAGEALAKFGTVAEKAANLPWGWIAAAAIGVGILAYKLATLKDATQSWIDATQAGINNSSAGSMTSIMQAQTATSIKLADAQKALTATTNADTMANAYQRRLAGGDVTVYANQLNAVRELTQGQQQFNAQQQLYRQRLGGLAKTYGSTAEAQGLLIAGGIKMGDFLSKDGATWLQVQQEIKATSIAYQQMGQTGGALGADMFILDKLAGDQYTTMQKLNQSWTTFLGLSTGLASGFNGLVTGMRSLNADMRKAHNDFTGTSNASITLQNAFEQQITQTQAVIGSMRQAGAHSKDLANVLSSTLKPAVDRGALSNEGFRNQVYALAVQAHYTGPNAIGPLTRWVDHNATSVARAAREAQHWAAVLAHIPKNVPVLVSIYASLSGPGAAIITGANGGNGYSPGGERRVAAPGLASGTNAATPGWHWVGEKGPELAYFSGGETVIPHHIATGYANGVGYAAPGGGVTELHVYLDGEEMQARLKVQTYDYNGINGNRTKDGRVRGTWVPRG